MQSQTGNYYVIDVSPEKQQFVIQLQTHMIYIPELDVIPHILTGERSVLNYLASPHNVRYRKCPTGAIK